VLSRSVRMQNHAIRVGKQGGTGPRIADGTRVNLPARIDHDGDVTGLWRQGVMATTSDQPPHKEANNQEQHGDDNRHIGRIGLPAGAMGVSTTSSPPCFHAATHGIASAPYRADMASILVIEDDPILGKAMAMHLRHAGFEVDLAEDGERGLRRLRHARPDVAIVDLMLPGLDGWAVTEAIREDHLGVPVIVVSARGSEHDKVHTLEIGADDYLSKPFGMRELIARIEALLRRTRLVAASEPRGEAVLVEGLRIDPDLRRAFVRTADGQPENDWEDAQLTPTEFRLVVALARQEGKALSRDELQRRVWGIPYRHRDRTVDVCVRKIREKLDRRSPSHDYVHTHYGVGYRFAAEAR